MERLLWELIQASNRIRILDQLPLITITYNIDINKDKKERSIGSYYIIKDDVKIYFLEHLAVGTIDIKEAKEILSERLLGMLAIETLNKL